MTEESSFFMVNERNVKKCQRRGVKAHLNFEYGSIVNTLNMSVNLNHISDATSLIILLSTSYNPATYTIYHFF